MKKVGYKPSMAGAVEAVICSLVVREGRIPPTINFQEQDEIVAISPPTEAEPLNENLFKSVEEFELSVRSANCLQNANIAYIGELVIESIDTKGASAKLEKMAKENVEKVSPIRMTVARLNRRVGTAQPRQSGSRPNRRPAASSATGALTKNTGAPV